MKAVVQRVSEASVEVEGRSPAKVAAIGRGLVVLVGIEAGDTDADLAWMADKVANLRIFEDAAGKMNLSVRDGGGVGGEVLLVPNFTVAGDARKGRRPSFDGAMRPEESQGLFQRLAAAMEAILGAERVRTGVFRAHMRVGLVNDGPVTILLDSRG
jgi:D-aminoacyl-tRNA deacylase